MSGYRLTAIDVQRDGLLWMAHGVLEDLGDDDSPFRGFSLRVGPYSAFTHKRAWKKALKDNGGRLW